MGAHTQRHTETHGVVVQHVATDHRVLVGVKFAMAKLCFVVENSNNDRYIV